MHKTHTWVVAVEATEREQPFAGRIDQLDRVRVYQGSVNRWPITVMPMCREDHGISRRTAVSRRGNVERRERARPPQLTNR